MTTTFVFSRKMALTEKIKLIFRTLGFIGQPPIETYSHLIDYIAKNAAFVSQVTLYTYVKARAGTQYPKLFTNEDFLTSLRIARWHIFGAAVADMALFSAAQFHASGALDQKQTEAYASVCFWSRAPLAWNCAAEKSAMSATAAPKICHRAMRSDVRKSSFVKSFGYCVPARAFT